MTDTKKQPRTRRSSDNGFAQEGAVAQDGRLPVYVCNACQREVVWATSRKTGRKYLVNVTRGYHHQRFYMKHNAHTADYCAGIVREREEWERRQNFDAREMQLHALRDVLATFTEADAENPIVVKCKERIAALEAGADL